MDITAMVMVILYVSVYLYALRNPDKKRIAAIVLGALAFIAFKTKETTVFVNFLLIGFVLDEQGKWNWQAFKDLIRPVLTGLAAGIGLFILLDGLILGKPFFAISPSTFAAVFKIPTFNQDSSSAPPAGTRSISLMNSSCLFCCSLSA